MLNLMMGDVVFIGVFVIDDGILATLVVGLQLAIVDGEQRMLQRRIRGDVRACPQ